MIACRHSHMALWRYDQVILAGRRCDTNRRDDAWPSPFRHAFCLSRQLKRGLWADKGTRSGTTFPGIDITSLRVNRVLVLTVRAVMVAERLGFDRRTPAAQFD